MLRMARLLPFVALGLWFGWFLPHTAWGPTILYAAALFIAWTVVHVLGRAAGVRVVGFHTLLVRIGPLAAIAGTGGWTLHLTPARSIAGFEYTPSLDVPISMGGLRWRLIALVLAGPVIFAAVAGALFAAAVARGSSVLAFIAVLAAVVLVDEMIPWPRRQHSRETVGLWLWSWLYRPQDAAQRTAMFMLWLQLALPHGLRPRQIHETWVELAVGEAHDPARGEGAEGSWLAYFCAIDDGDIAGAATRIGRTLAWTGKSGTALERSAVVEAAFLAARYQDDVQRAERLLMERIATIDAGLLDDLARAQAAVYLARGRFADALACCTTAMEPVPVKLPPDIDLLRRAQGTGEPTGGHGAFHRDQVRAIEAAARAALEAISS